MNRGRPAHVARPFRPCTPRASRPWEGRTDARDVRATHGQDAHATHGRDASHFGLLVPSEAGGRNSDVGCSAPRARARGVVLLEVVLAVALFALAAGVVGGGLSGSLRTARRLEAEATAADLAVTVVSWLDLGLLPLEDAGPEAFEDEDRLGWTWQVMTGPADDAAEIDDGLVRVEITVRNRETGGLARVVHWLAQADAGSGEQP